MLLFYVLGPLDVLCNSFLFRLKHMFSLVACHYSYLQLPLRDSRRAAPVRDWALEACFCFFSFRAQALPAELSEKFQRPFKEAPAWLFTPLRVRSRPHRSQPVLSEPGKCCLG